MSPFSVLSVKPAPTVSLWRGVSYAIFSGTLAALLSLSAGSAQAQTGGGGPSGADFARQAERLRENAINRMGPRVQTRGSSEYNANRQPGSATSRNPYGSSGKVYPVADGINYNNNTRKGGGNYPWKRNIITTVFWVGERPTPRNPTPNHASSWDPQWASNFGGYDNPDPKFRRGFIPASFTPRQNPFYIALPYNDVTRGTTKPEGRFVIPWFKREFQRVGRSVCKGRWVAIRKGNRVAYAQWEDCGPFRTDHWQYVFGNERPKPNINGGAGLDVSPAVRDYLGMSNKDVCDWKFVEFHEVPYGPWSRFGENNTFVQRARHYNGRMADRRGDR